MENVVCWVSAFIASGTLSFMGTVWIQLKRTEAKHNQCVKDLEEASTRLLHLEIWKEKHERAQHGKIG